MVQDIDSILRQYESASDREPMHGRPGEIRRQPSTDEKRIKRKLRRSQAELEEPTVAKSTTASIADLLGQATVAATDSERQSLMLQVESLRTAAAQEHEAAFGYDFVGAKIHGGVVPAPIYERTTADSDWMLGLPTTADLRQASNEMVVQASLWFHRADPEAKAYPGEFAEQAANLARRLAGQYGDQAPAVEQVFLQEANRLRSLAVRTGAVKEAVDELVADTVGEMKDGADTTGLAELSGQVGEQYRQSALAATENTALVDEIMKEGASGVPQVGEQGLPEQEFSNLAGETHLPEGATDSNRAPQLQELQNYNGWSGSSVVPPDSGQAETANAGDIGPQDAAQPQQGFPVGAAKTASQDPAFSSGRSVTSSTTKESHMTQAQGAQKTANDALHSLGLTHGLQGDRPASDHPDYMAGHSQGTSMAREQRGSSTSFDGGRPVGSSFASAHAACPTCGGQGKVAVRQLDPRQAYSGLPQIDEIMNNSDTAPEQTEFPAQVAWPIDGGGWSPGTMPSAINQAEQQIAQRNQLKGASVQPTGPHFSFEQAGQNGVPSRQPNGRDGGQAIANYRQAIETQANGRDNSGWMGDDGARGTDYPGYSTPNYGGPSNLGQPDPVYGEGGDNGNQPLLPYGHQEAEDFTNNPPQWQPGQPTQADQAWRQTAPNGGMNTQGQLNQAQRIAAVQQQIAQSQAQLAAIYEGRA